MTVHIGIAQHVRRERELRVKPLRLARKGHGGFTERVHRSHQFGNLESADLAALSTAQLRGIGTASFAALDSADLAVYDLDHPRFFGLHDPAIGPVACGGRADLRWLFVGGTEVVSDNRLPGVDLAELAVQARVAVSGLLSRL